MNRSRNCIAIRAGLALAALCIATFAAAASSTGIVERSSGLVFAQSADGRAKILAEGSSVAVGDTLSSGKATFARIVFADGGAVVLGPETRLAIDAFAFDPGNPAGNRAELTLASGTALVTSGTIARQGADRQKLNTVLGTVTGVGSSFVVNYVPTGAASLAMAARVMLAALSPALSATLSDAQPLRIGQLSPIPLPPSGTLAPGLYVRVIDGLVHVANQGGSTSFSAGQFGYTPSFIQPPVVLPNNPGIQFTPPPSFSSSSGPSGGTNSKSNSVDCEVR